MNSGTPSSSGESASIQESDVAAALEAMMETLRSCRANLRERGASAELRELEVKIGYLALALDWAADGETKKAKAALALARGLPIPGSSDAALFNEDWTLWH